MAKATTKCQPGDKWFSLYMSQEAHHAAAYPSFCSMKLLIFLPTHPVWDARPSQGNPQYKVFICHGGEAL